MLPFIAPEFFVNMLSLYSKTFGDLMSSKTVFAQRWQKGGTMKSGCEEFTHGGTLA
jgi:hypothetical protein